MTVGRCEAALHHFERRGAWRGLEGGIEGGGEGLEGESPTDRRELNNFIDEEYLKNRDNRSTLTSVLILLKLVDKMILQFNLKQTVTIRKICSGKMIVKL